jgi:hypothetical protein
MDTCRIPFIDRAREHSILAPFGERSNKVMTSPRHSHRVVAKGLLAVPSSSSAEAKPGNSP